MGSVLSRSVKTAYEKNLDVLQAVLQYHLNFSQRVFTYPGQHRSHNFLAGKSHQPMIMHR